MDIKIKRATLAAFAVAASAIPVKALLYRPVKTNVEPLENEFIDTARYRKNLSDAIKIPTIANKDPKLTDWKSFEAFRNFLEERYPLIHSKLEKIEVCKGPVVFKWSGCKPALEPIALLAHQDVVPVAQGTYNNWKRAPFEGFDDGEFIWGRGALDMKNHLIAIMESVETLLQENFVPERDVYICLGHNEEVMSSDASGAVFICDYFVEKGVHFDCVIDEGGAILPVSVKGVINKNIAGVGVAEKGYADFDVSVAGKGGHSSISPNHTAIGALANVIRDIEKNQFKSSLSPMMMELFDKIGRNCSYPVRLITCNIKLLKSLITKIMSYIPPAASLIRTTQGVTMASGSAVPNVLPQRASVNVNIRLYPGETVQDAENHLRKAIKNKKAQINLKPGWKNSSKISPTSSRCFKAIEEICKKLDKDNIVAPYLVMGGSDACHYERVCNNIYRYSPFKVSAELLLTTHGTNERLPVASIPDALRFFKYYIKTLSAE